ncbi:MAG: 4'-phosphopantetheinyl transferase superfamily protein [Coriobacteriales bacterium]|nr:4'-phosphopantetheinyl transferase superfamily protein [Coriobacteriales bacterium]
MPSHLYATVLVDNSDAPGMCCEWGLSLHVRYGQRSVLLDFGQSRAFARNAQALSIDLNSVDIAVLSHAHYDHANGMDAFFRHNDHASLFLSEACTQACWSSKGNTAQPHYIGIQDGMLERHAHRLRYVSTRTVTTIAPGIHLVPHTTAGLAQKGERDGMLVARGTTWEPDDFSHELSLVFELDGAQGPALGVFSSCSHAGPAAIVSEVRAAFGNRRIAAFVGGLHLFRANDAHVREVAHALDAAGVRSVWTGHCTGDHALKLLRSELPNRVWPFAPGMRFSVDSLDWSPDPALQAPVDLEVAIRGGASSWGAHESGRIVLNDRNDTLTLPIAYDEREAPLVTDEHGREQANTLVGLADEGHTLACALARTEPGCAVVGVGVDLARAADFARPGTERLLQSMFSQRERELAPTLYPKDLPLAFATLFGAKEAAFKACAHALRTWYAAHDEPLTFEVRDFGMEEPWEERGELRHGAAQRALDRMGIRRIEIRHTTLGDKALVVAVALA